MSNDQESRRLQQLYAALGDGELLRLAAGKAGLTEVARHAIDAEMGARGLELPADEAETVAERLSDEPDTGHDPSMVELITFQIPIDAETAMRLLAEHDVPAHMEHAVRQVNEDGPKVKMNWLSVFVERADKEDAMSVLRKGMGLFPVMAADEIGDPGDAVDDEDALLMVGNFQEAADAELAQKALTDAGIWFKATVDTEEDAEWEGTTIEVKMEDLERALEVVEQAFGEAE